jgi:putative ABC transport system permease protein
VFLALREIRRSPLRFALLTAAVGLLVFLIVFQTLLKDGLITQFIGAIRNQSAPVLVYGAQARQNLEGSQITAEQLAAIEAAAAPRPVGRLGQGTFTVSTAVTRARADERDRLVDAAIFGFELSGPAAQLGAPTTLSAGRLPQADDEAVASAADTDEGFDIGDVVRVEPDGLEITVVGLADDVRFSVSATLFVSYPTYEAARRIRNPDAERVNPTVAVVGTLPGESADDAAAVLRAAGLAEVEPLTKSEAVDQAPGVANVRSSLDTVIGLLYFASLVIVGLFLNILTVQKLGPLALLRAMGARTRSLVWPLLIQAVVIVAGGTVVGGAVLALVAPGLADIGVGFDVPALSRVGVTTMIVAVVASATAVLRIARIDPVEATSTAGVLR